MGARAHAKRADGAAGGPPPPSNTAGEPGASCHAPQGESGDSLDIDVARRVLGAPGAKGVDIGGSLVKVALALPQEVACENHYPGEFGMTGRTRYDLAFDFSLDGHDYALRFISAATAQMEAVITSWWRNQDAQYARNGLCLPGGPVAAGKDGLRDPESFLHSGTPSTKSSQSSGPDDLDTLDDTDSEAATPRAALQQIYTAGGGAHKFAPLFRNALQVELVPVRELAAVVDGLLFLIDHGPREGWLFTVGEDGRPMPLSWPEQLFPFLIVNIGSGVSILRVDSAKEGDFVRVGGTACGGGTFLGLARALTSAETFDDALRLAEGGNAACCDLLVRDIYGEEGSASLGLPGSLTAANFGRLCEHCGDDGHGEEGGPGCGGGASSEQNVARALLQMVTQQSVLLSSAFARQSSCVDRVFFVGGFVEEENHLARTAIAANYRSLGGCAYFLRHADYLGALGSLRSCLCAGGRA